MSAAKINDLGLPWTADTHSGAEKMRLSEPTTKIGMKIDSYYQRQKCRPMVLVSGGIRFMRIFAEPPWRGGVKRPCMRLSRTAIFSVFAGYFFSETLEMRPALLYSDTQSVVGFSSQNAWPWMTLNGYFALNSVFAPVWLLRTFAFRKIIAWKLITYWHILSAAQIFGRESTFWQYQVCAHIRWGSLERRG